MPAATRKNDGSTGHGPWPPRSNIAGSGKVFINGIAAHRQGDGWPVHCDNSSPPNCHATSTSGGSSKVFIDGTPAARVGDAISCGDTIAAGSPNVFIGG